MVDISSNNSEKGAGVEVRCSTTRTAFHMDPMAYSLFIHHDLELASIPDSMYMYIYNIYIHIYIHTCTLRTTLRRWGWARIKPCPNWMRERVSVLAPCSKFQKFKKT